MSALGFDAKLGVGSVSMVDRCSDFMDRAYPDTEIDITGSHVETDAANATAVTVQGMRSGVPPNAPYARDVAVECRFEGGVLTSFRWTADPVRPATTGQVP